MKTFLKILGAMIGVLLIAGVTAYFAWFHNPYEHTLQLDPVSVYAGMSNADVLRSATISPARFLGLDDTMGSIAEGKVASFLMLDRNPLEDVRNSQSINRVMLDGYWIE